MLPTPSNTTQTPIAGANKYETRAELQRAIRENMDEYGNNCDLNYLDVSGVTDFRSVFQNLPFTGDISHWDVSNAKSMMRMFQGSAFDGDISQWRVGNVKNMQQMFADSRFNGNLSLWDTASVINMELMFESSHFNNDISSWNVQNVITFTQMFSNGSFLGDLSSWRPRKDARMGKALSEDLVAKMPTSVFHWQMAAADPELLGKPQRAHWDNLFPIATAMGMSPSETVFWMQDQWREKSTPGLNYALPEMELE